MPLEQIRNFLLADDRIATAGQPTEAQLHDVASARYAAVINLGMGDHHSALADEAGLAAALALDYRHLPVRFDAPALSDFESFLAQMDDWRSRRVLVHCVANYRVSSFMSVYGELRLGWTREHADEHACHFWQPNETWQDFLAACRARFIGR
jgi:protein tyrosine phosphatase (PTP) superfamily phosphohydrolase (DUF442 family)